MFEIGDIVRHKATGITGKVIGFGKHKIADRRDRPTLKVELQSYDSIKPKPMAEDLVERWKTFQSKKVLACTLPYFPKRTPNRIVSANNF